MNDIEYEVAFAQGVLVGERRALERVKCPYCNTDLKEHSEVKGMAVHVNRPRDCSWLAFPMDEVRS